MGVYAFIYPGQGSQAVGMGKDFVDNFDVAREFVCRASDSLGIDFGNLLNDEDLLARTEYAQPCILLVSAIAHAVLQREVGITPSIAFGHSLGEVSAYCINGGAGLEDSIALVHERGKMMRLACESSAGGEQVGMLVCIGLSEDKVLDVVNDSRSEGKSVWVANFNFPGQTVLAGTKDDLQHTSVLLGRAGSKRTALLNMDVASHCPLLDSARDSFFPLLRSTLKDSSVGVISNATLEVYNDKERAASNLAGQLVSPVLYHETVNKAVSLGVTRFIELGHGCVLGGINKRITSVPTVSVNGIGFIDKVRGEL